MQMLELDVDVVLLVRRSRLRWYGHVLRREEESGIKRVLCFEVVGNRGRGHPRLSWRKQVDKDRITVRTGTEAAEDKLKCGVSVINKKIFCKICVKNKTLLFCNLY